MEEKKHNELCKESYLLGIADAIQNKWISIKEKLPEQDGRYLVVENNHHRWVGVSSLRNGKFDLEITHWMYLPVCPK